MQKYVSAMTYIWKLTVRKLYIFKYLWYRLSRILCWTPAFLLILAFIVSFRINTASAIEVDYLPSLITWDADAYPNQEYYDEQVRLIELGHQIIPTIYIGAPGTEITNTNVAHYRKIFSLASELDLPVSIRFPDWKYWLTLNPYFTLPAADNPNFLDMTGTIQPKVSPMGKEDAWAELGTDWGHSPIFRVLQQWYPDPPFILFLSQDREAEVSPEEMLSSHRFTQQFGSDRSNEFIEDVIDEGYRTRYEVLIDSFHETFTSWNDKAIFYYERGSEDADNITRILHSGLGETGQSVTQKVTSSDTESAFLTSVVANSFIPAETVQGNIEQSTTAIVRLWTRKPRVLLVPEAANPESSDALTARILSALDEIRIHPELRQFWYHGETLSEQSIQELDTAFFIEISQPDETAARLLLVLSKSDENNMVDITLSDGEVVQLQAAPGGSYYILDQSGNIETVAAYDGNGDAVPDREQLSVASLPTPSRVGTLTLESMASGEFVNTQFVASEASLRKHNLESTAKNVVYAQGLEGAEFLVTTLRQPQLREAKINLFIPEEYLNMNFYLGFGQNDFTEHSLQKLSDSRGHLALTVTDGGRGDVDGVQNGEIALLGIFAPPGGSPDVEVPSADPVVCYPNPFNPSRSNVRIRFNELAGEKNIRIYDLGGRLVTTLHSSSAVSEVQWDGFNGVGQQVASGTYFVVVENPEMQRIVEKISLIR